VYPFAVEAWKLAARMGEKEDWFLGLLSRLLFNLVIKKLGQKSRF
jgi:hypothetical protein